MEETAATTVSLPDDMVRHILLRVDDPAALFRCAVTCKPWSRLVADSSFLSHRWPDQDARRTFLAGFLTWHPPKPAAAATSFVPTPRSVFGPGRRSLGSLFPDDDARLLLDNAEPLTARRGLLLVRVRLASDDEDDTVLVRLAVCNLLVGVCDVLPPLRGDPDFDKSGYAILTGADCSSSSSSSSAADQQLSTPPDYSTFSKVIILGMMDNGRPPELYVFSASEARWSLPTKLIFDTAKKTRIGGSVGHPDGLVCGDTVHWPFGKWSRHCWKSCTLDVNTETYRVSRTNTMAPANNYRSRTYDEPQLRVSADGRLSLIFLRRSSLTLQIYMRQDNGKSEDAAARWISNGIVELKPPEETEGRTTPRFLSMLGEKGGMMLLQENGRIVYTADLQTGAMNEVADCLGSQLIRPKVMLLEMDWRAFFAYRLGSW